MSEFFNKKVTKSYWLSSWNKDSNKYNFNHSGVNIKQNRNNSVKMTSNEWSYCSHSCCFIFIYIYINYCKNFWITALHLLLQFENIFL